MESRTSQMHQYELVRLATAPSLARAMSGEICRTQPCKKDCRHDRYATQELVLFVQTHWSLRCWLRARTEHAGMCASKAMLAIARRASAMLHTSAPRHEGAAPINMTLLRNIVTESLTRITMCKNSNLSDVSASAASLQVLRALRPLPHCWLDELCVRRQ